MISKAKIPVVGAWFNCRMRAWTPAPHCKTGVPARCRGYLEENRIKKINLLKLDIEGQELIALRGLSAALNLQMIEVIYLEVATDVLDRYRLAPGDVIGFLESNGFRLFYCRDKDVPERCSPAVRFKRSNLNQLRLLEFKLPAENLRTDLLAVHKALIANL